MKMKLIKRGESADVLLIGRLDVNSAPEVEKALLVRAVHTADGHSAPPSSGQSARQPVRPQNVVTSYPGSFAAGPSGPKPVRCA